MAKSKFVRDTKNVSTKKFEILNVNCKGANAMSRILSEFIRYRNRTHSRRRYGKNVSLEGTLQLYEEQNRSFKEKKLFRKR